MNEMHQKDQTPEEKIRQIISLLGSPDNSVRKQAVISLSSINGPEAIKCLAAYLTHKDNMVRYSVRKALNDIKARGGSNFSEASGVLTSAADKTASEVKMGSIITIFFILIIISSGIGYYLYFKTDRQPSTVRKAFAATAKTAADVKNDYEKYNVIRRDEKGTPVLTIKGFVSQLNKIKREATIFFGTRSDGAIVAFPENIKMNIDSGANVEIVGELVRNDNIGPVLIKCRSVKTLRK